MVDVVEGEDGGVELVGEVEDLLGGVEDAALAVAVPRDGVGVYLVEGLAREGVFDLAHPGEVGGVENHVHRMEADDLEARRGEKAAVRLDGQPQLVVEETAVFEENGNLQQLGFQPVWGDSGGERRDGVGTAPDVVVVAEQMRRVGDVEGAVRTRTGGFRRKREAGLDDLAEGAAVRGTGQEVGMYAALQTPRPERPLDHVRRVRDKYGQSQKLRRKQTEVGLHHRLRCPINVRREAEHRPLVPFVRPRRPLQQFLYFIHDKKLAQKYNFFVFSRPYSEDHFIL